MSYESNILKAYRQATDTDVSVGLSWYDHAHKIAESLGNIEIGAGVLAALSPQISWKRNIELAHRAIETGTATGTLGANCRKANQILTGTPPLEVLSGPKTRCFYLNILEGSGSAFVTIDRHAQAIAGETKTLTPKRYQRIAQAYQNVAKKVGLAPAQLQAITWVAWRRKKGIVD